MLSTGYISFPWITQMTVIHRIVTNMVDTAVQWITTEGRLIESKKSLKQTISSSLWIRFNKTKKLAMTTQTTASLDVNGCYRS